jgi:integrase
MSERVARLTKRTVDGAAVADARYVLWDTELKGFGLRVETSGTKTFILRYRPKSQGGSAPKRFLTLGRYGPLTAEQARSKALSVLGTVAVGADPAVKLKSRASLSLAEAAEIFLREHVRPKRKASTAEYYDWLLRRSLIPVIGHLPADRVTRADVLKLHSDLQSSPYQANRTLAVLSSLFGFLSAAGYVPEGCNPTRGVERYREEGRERYLTSEELKRLGAGLREAETVGLPWQLAPESARSKHLAKPEKRRTRLDPGAVAAIRLLVLTGARLREILHLRWDEVDFDRGLVFLADSKTGRKTLILSTAAITLLRTLPRIGDYVIPGAKTNTPRSDLKKPWAAIQAHSGLEGVRLHDLRHTFASIGAGASLGLPIVGKLLGHSQPQTTARYAHLDASPLRQAANLIADQISASLLVEDSSS